jgi:chromatin modification-related protein EAF6
VSYNAAAAAVSYINLDTFFLYCIFLSQYHVPGSSGTKGKTQDAQTPASTPASHAPTPVSTSFGNNRDGGGGAGGAASSAPTPTSATGGGRQTGKKSKKSAAAAAAAAAASGVEDSETDSRETKKIRTSFGAVRR